MSKTKRLPVSELHLDLRNYRTVPQVDEPHAIRAMVAINPGWFWALMDSLLDSGYLPTENILVLEDGATPPKRVVREGNRRIAALKLILGYLPADTVDLPDVTASRIRSLSSEWRAENAQVPCAVYGPRDADVVDRIVTLTHGKGQQAGRDPWTAVSRARHNRDVNKASQPDLDLLEKFLTLGRHLTASQVERWAGEYPLSVLEEAMKRLAPSLGLSNSAELATRYPTVAHRGAVDTILLDIGLGQLRFDRIRSRETDFAQRYGIPPLADTAGTNPASASPGVGPISRSQGTRTASPSAQSAAASSPTAAKGANPSTGTGSTAGEAGKRNGAPAAVSATDPRAVRRALRAFKPMGKQREKVVSLRDEAVQLNLGDTPLAFCFLLRSMFEISAKAYCDDHQASGGPSASDKTGRERKLVEVLRDVCAHLTAQNQQTPMTKKLHGAMAELAKPTSVLSVTSMNQLVHNPSFHVTPSDLCTAFGNIFPLLEAMNA